MNDMLNRLRTEQYGRSQVISVLNSILNDIAYRPVYDPKQVIRNYFKAETEMLNDIEVELRSYKGE